MKSIPPQAWLLLAIVLYGLLAVAVTRATLNTPWLGIHFEAESGTGGIRIRELHEDGPAAGRLVPGAQVRWIGAHDLPPFQLLTGDLLEDPDHAPDYAGYRAFLERQSEIYTRLRQPVVILGLGDGHTVELRPEDSRPLSSLPPLFWFQLLCAMTGFLVAAAVWAFCPHSRAVGFFALSGIGLLVTLLPTTAYISRELAHDGDMIRALSVINHFGGVLFVAGLAGITWNYPVRLGRFNADIAAAALLLLVWAVDTAQLLDTVSQGYWYPMLVVGAGGIGCIVRQWQLARTDPAARAIISWLLLAAIIGPGMYIVLFLVPIFLGSPPLVSQAMSWGFLTLFFVMTAFGVSRYRLFELEAAWQRAWGWVLGGISVVLLDLLLVYLFGVGEEFALLSSLVLVGFLYFPLRQKIWGLFPWQSREQGLLELLPDLLGLALDPRTGPTESEWLLALHRVFEPLEIRGLSEPVGTVALHQDALALRIPGFEACPAVELYCARRGARLFNARDIEFASALRLLFERAVLSRKAFEHGARTERARIARDLHDDIGAMLLSMVYRSSVPEVNDMAREALARVRAVIHSLEAGECSLSEALPEWRREAKDRCDAADIRLTWWQDELPRDPLLNSWQQVNLKRLMQEAITNIIKHSRARSAEVLVSFGDKDLLVSVSDDGIGLDDSRPSGSGMNNMRRRARELGGDIQWQPAGVSGCRVTLTVPFSREAAGA